MSKPQNPQTDTYPLFLTVAAHEGRALPSSCLRKQIYILLDSGVPWSRLNPDLRAAYVLGYYLGNVRNGGHSQFISNARKHFGGDPEQFLKWAMEAAERYEMRETLNVMRDVLTWMIENPKEAASQMGYNPYVSPALEPHNVALFRADMVDEKTWLAYINTFPETLAQTCLQSCGYGKGNVKFPTSAFDSEELRFLTKFDPVKIIADDAFEDEIKAIAAADPAAQVGRVAARIAILAQRLPKSVTCSALSIFAQGAHLPATTNLRSGAGKTSRPDREGVLAIARGGHGFVLELGAKSLSVFEAKGDPDAVFENLIEFSVAPTSFFRRLLNYNAPNRRMERLVKSAERDKIVRKKRLLAKLPNSVGDEITALNKRFHLHEALALWLEQTNGSTASVNWRLEKVEPDCIHWQYEIGHTRLSVVASDKEVQISSGGKTLFYPHADLRALRQGIENRSRLATR